MKEILSFLRAFSIRSLLLRWNDRYLRIKRILRVKLLFPVGFLAVIFLCSTIFADIQSYAPVAAREIPTRTPTPFLPSDRTPTTLHVVRHPTPTNTPATVQATQLPTVTTVFDPARPWAPYAGPIRPSSTPIPTPAEEFPIRADVMNIALLGVDSLEAEKNSRTDTIMILSLNRSTSSASLISFPRDLFVYIPAYGMQRINLAFPQGRELGYPGGGFGLFRDTMQYNFGLPVDHYILVDFMGFKELIDSLGGIDIYVSTELTDFRLGHGTFTMPVGNAHMDGYTALWYARSRNTTSDFDRQRRQQEVLQAVAQRLLDLRALDNIPGFYRILTQYVESDLTLGNLTPFVDLALSLQPSAAKRYGFTAKNGCRNWTTPERMMVLLPDYVTIHEMLLEALSP